MGAGTSHEFETSEAMKEFEKARKQNLEDIIRHAKWEAEMVKRQGKEWFKKRDEWLNQAHKVDTELIRKNPEVRKALMKLFVKGK
ncbi:MAG: hypothetical protein HA495_02435 [Thaumarchaeota archaeon]|nr:hypothetical protein [Nitrososphaerota archaeon]